MNEREFEIESSLAAEDAAFAQRLAEGPRLSVRYRVGLASATILGLALVMAFTVHVAFGLLGYAVLVVAGTSLLRRRALKPVNEPPLAVFHRLTAGMFRNTPAVVEPGLD